MYTTTDIESVTNTQEMLKNFNLVLDEGYIQASTIRSIIIGLLCAACFILAVIFIKNSRGLGVTAAILQFAGMFAAGRYVIAFSKIDFTKFVVVEYGSSYEEATNKAMDSMASNTLETLPGILLSSLWNMVLILATIFALIYVIKVMKSSHKALGIPALILVIARFIISPLQYFTLFSRGGIPMSAQANWDGFYCAFYLLPALLVAAMAVISFVKSKKAPAAEVETPADETANIELK